MTDDREFKIPRVWLVCEIEKTPRVVVQAESEADRLALVGWIRLTFPQIHDVLATADREQRDRRRAA